MGCLNSEGKFPHWFANIHLSGPCNRSCYFCVGQHMMALDSYNNLDRWPLLGIEEFVDECNKRGIKQIDLTGTNTDPLLYRHHAALSEYLCCEIPGVDLGIRTNGVAFEAAGARAFLALYDKVSVTLCSTNPHTYRKMMGQGEPPDMDRIAEFCQIRGIKLKVNIVLGPENTGMNFPDLYNTIELCRKLDIEQINLREPYGQPHVGDPLENLLIPEPVKVLGMPEYLLNINGRAMSIVYWDVHYVEVESVNLYANGHISIDYPITRGHDPKTGSVMPQKDFPGGRVREQWVSISK